MNAKSSGEKILQELNYNFATFTIEDFIHQVGQFKKRKILTISWHMPPGLFGAWISNGDDTTEYIFYREDVPPIHQIHIQLHELAHILLGHSTMRVTKDTLLALLQDGMAFPFRDLARMRFLSRMGNESEAEILAGLIQEQVIQHALLDRLTQGISTNDHLAGLLLSLGLTR